MLFQKRQSDNRDSIYIYHDHVGRTTGNARFVYAKDVDDFYYIS